MIYWRLSRAVTLAAAAAAVGLAAAPATAATSGTFTATGSMHAAHTQGRATLLPDGEVLVTGANSGGGAALPSPELYNPAAGTWAVTGQMNTSRIDATATLLPDGQVLVAGGSGGGSNALSSAELYNPAAGTWSVTGSMRQGRSGLNGAGASATLLPDGQVLIAGGEDANFNTLSSAELYNPATGTFTPTGSMTTPRTGQSATLLNNGQVLFAGGTNATAAAAAELYNPATGKFTATGSMSAARGGNVGTLLPGGDVLVTQGSAAGLFAERYDPATGQWSNASTGLHVCISTQECQSDSTATLLGTGNVLVAGGLVGLVSNPQTTPTALLYHPATNTWTATGSMTTGRENQTATLLPDGQVLMAGGTLFDHPHVLQILASAELYTP
jgi:hypothetical protein